MLKKKIEKLLIGTNNKGKLKEIRDLLPKNTITLSTAEFKLKSPKENGKSFKENSLIKSKYFSKKTNLICLADDSGLEIDILDKNPGIYSARSLNFFEILEKENLIDLAKILEFILQDGVEEIQILIKLLKGFIEN